MTRAARRLATRAFLAPIVGAALAFGAPAALAAQNTHTISGTVRDSASGLPIAGVAVDLAGTSFGRGVRSDDRGAFTFTRVPAGDYQLFVRQIGFIGTRLQLTISADTTLHIALVSIARGLDTVRVRAAITGIRGVVGTARDLRPLARTKIQVIGAEHDATTDSLGRFFVQLEKAGAYTMRVSHSGFAPEVRSVDVAKDSVVETATLLDSSLTQPKNAESLWADYAARARMRGPNSAIVTGSEVRRYGGSLMDALRGSPSFVSHGLHFGPTTCVFVNGRPEPGLPLDAIRVEDVASIELYGPSDEATNTLSWPHYARCGENIAVRPLHGVGNSATTAVLAAVWLK